MSQLRTSLILEGDERSLTAALQRGEAGIEQLGRGVDRLSARQNSARASAEVFQQAIANQRQSLDMTRAALDPVFRASKQYEAVQLEVQRAVTMGTATQTEANRIMALAEAQYLATGTSANAMGVQSRQATGNVANVFAQLNDIGMMMAAGQNPFQLALQQGTQLNQVFATMGGRAEIFRTLGRAMMSMINPVSLVTIGLIAGSAALLQWATSSGDAEDKTDDLADAMTSLDQRAKDARAELEALMMGVGSTEEARVMQQIQALDAQLAELRTDDPNYFGGRNRQTQIRQIEAERAALVAALEAAQADEARLALAQAINATTERAEAIMADNLRNARDVVSELRNEAALRDLIARAGEDSEAVGRMRIEQERALFVLETERLPLSEALKDEMIAAWDAAKGLGATDMRQGIEEARRVAQDLADEIDRAVTNAETFAQQGVRAQDRARINFEFRDDPIGRAGALARAEFDARAGDPNALPDGPADSLRADRDAFVAARVEAARYQQQLDEWQRSQTSSRRGGRQQVTAADRVIADIDRQMAKLAPTYARDTAALREWRDEALAALNPAAEGFDAFRQDIETIFDLSLAEAYQRDLARRTDFASGVARSLADINGDLMTWASIGEDLVADWSKGLEDQFVALNRTGKFQIDDLVNHTLDQFARLAYQRALQPLVNSSFDFIATGLGAAFGQASATGAAAGATVTQSHSGSTIGTGGVRRSYGLGAPLRADERLTVTTLGQRVFTPQQISNGATVVDALASAAAAGRAGTTAVTFAPEINVINNGETPVSARVEDRGESGGRRRFDVILQEEVGNALSRRGGGASKALEHRYGVQPKGPLR